MKTYTPPVTTYVDNIMNDAIFLNPAPNAKYWLTLMNEGDGYITVRLKQVILPNIAMMKIDKNKNCRRDATKINWKS